MLFPLPENWFFVLSHSWVPQKKVDADNEKLDWYNLKKEGLLTIVQGDYVDYQLVFDWFVAMRNKYKIQTVGYDPAKAFWLVKKMREAGFALNDVRQGELTLTAPLDDMRERFLDGKIVHNNNRMYNWYLGNVRLSKRGHNATYLPTKRNAYRKIDGFAASLNAYTDFMRQSKYYIAPDQSVATVINLS